MTIISIRNTMLGAASILPALLGAGAAHASAFYIQEQSTVAVGRAFSGEVSQQGAQQMWWNPAAVGGISTIQGYAGITAILPRANSSNVNTLVERPGVTIPGVGTIPGSVTPVGGAQNEHNPVNDGYLPNGGFAIPLNEHWAFGFTATSPYSFTTNYASDSWARYSADKTRLRTYDLQPVIAFSTGGLSIGAGPNIEYTRATLSNYLPDPIPALPFPLSAAGFTGTDGHQYLKGSGWNVGYSIGFQFHNDKVDLGVSYKSKIKHKLSGHLVIDGLTDPVLVASGANMTLHDIHARFDTPWQVNFGGRYHVTPQLTLNGQITRTGWEKFSAIAIYGSGLVPSAIPENYHNTWSYSVGFDYDITPRWTVRGGVQRDMSPIGASNRDPRVPDGNRWNFAAGTSFALNPHFTVDAAASYDKIKGNPIDKIDAAYAGTPLQTLILTSGRLRDARALIFSMGGRFSF